MNIGFDIHGTLDSSQTLRDFANFLADSPEHTVYIISGPEMDEIVKRLKKIGMDPNRFVLVSIIGYLKADGVKFWKVKVDGENRLFCDYNTWWGSKGRICKELSISIMFDNQIEYMKDMPETTTFLLYPEEVEN